MPSILTNLGKNGATLELERGNNGDDLESSKMVAGPGWEMI